MTYSSHKLGGENGSFSSSNVWLSLPWPISGATVLDVLMGIHPSLSSAKILGAKSIMLVSGT